MPGGGGGRGVVSDCGIHVLVSGKEFLDAVIFCMKGAFQKVFYSLLPVKASICTPHMQVNRKVSHYPRWRSSCTAKE